MVYRSNPLRKYIATLHCVHCDTPYVQAAHRNQGKGLGLKCSDGLEAALCPPEHFRIDQGKDLLRDERRSLMDDYIRKTHALGSVIAENIEAFAGRPAHDVLKRLQIEANIACDEIALNFPGLGPCTYRVPQSLSFESMDEARFNEVIGAMCRHVAKQYWPDMEPGQIEAMADLWVEAA